MDSPETPGPRPVYDCFLSHAGVDKPWVTSLQGELKRLGLSAFLDQGAIRPGDNFVLRLSQGLGDSRYLVLVVSETTLARDWVEQEWTAFLATHGPRGRIHVIRLAPVELPPLLAPVQRIDAFDRDAARAAATLSRHIPPPAGLDEADARRLPLGQDLRIRLAVEGEALRVTGPLGSAREVPLPWARPGFAADWLGFTTLTRRTLIDDAERAELHGCAGHLGETLLACLFPSEADAALLYQALQPGRSIPLLTLESADDRLLALPWELIRVDGYPVRDGRLDLARTTPDPLPARQPPAAGPFRLLVNVSAPAGSGLDYEAESYRITRALAGHCPLVPTELGTLDDLLATAATHQDRPGPLGVHFSGHGTPGALQFEDDYGEARTVTVAELVADLRTRLDGRLPPFFYLATCHGNEPLPGEDQEALPATAAALHRAGVDQVVGYFGPIVDELSTCAEEALYAALARGRSTRHGLRLARCALRDVRLADAPRHRPGRDGGGPAATHPYAWAQLVAYLRGGEQPLGRPATAADPDPERDLHRSFQGSGERRYLAAGFIGRRRELHSLRRRLRRGDRVLVLQGLGGLGKTTLAFHALPLLRVDPEREVCTLWCRESEDEADPLANLEGQLLAYARRRLGPAWDTAVQAVDRQVGADPLPRLAAFLQTLMGQVPRLALYLDNLESLLTGPQEGDPESLGHWRSDALRQLWRLLVQWAEQSPPDHRLTLIASSRYHNPDLEAGRLPVSPLPADALYRLMGWYPALRRLSHATRVRLVERLEGHPRAVEFCHDLIHAQLARWEARHGDYPGGDPDQEWRELVAPALPQVEESLRDDLLLAAIWERVLEPRARRMLYRMTLLRQPWEWALMAVLGEPDEPEAQAEHTAEALSRTSLLEQVETLRQRDGQPALVRLYTLHPATVRFIAQRHGEDPALKRQTHGRVGGYLEREAEDSPYIDTRIEAGHHLFQAGEYDRAFELLVSASDWLQEHDRVQEGLRLLEPFLEAGPRQALERSLLGWLLGTLGSANWRLARIREATGYFEQGLAIARETGDRRSEGKALSGLGLVYDHLGQVEKAIGYHEQQLVTAREIGDRQGQGIALGNLGIAHSHLGQVEKAIGYFEQRLVIAREIVDRRAEGNALGNLGLAYDELGQVDKAIACWQKALAIGRAIKDPRIVDICEGQLARYGR
jgi:tetratricopeptide (TPR) repeat protein